MLITGERTAAIQKEFNEVFPALAGSDGGLVLQDIEARVFDKPVALRSSAQELVEAVVDYDGTTISDQPVALNTARAMIISASARILDPSELRDPQLQAYFKIQQAIGSVSSHEQSYDEKYLANYITRRGTVEADEEPELNRYRQLAWYGNYLLLLKQLPFTDMAPMTQKLVDVLRFQGNTARVDAPLMRLAYVLWHDHHDILLSAAHLRTPGISQGQHKRDTIRRTGAKIGLEENPRHIAAGEGEGCFMVYRDHESNLFPFLPDGPMRKRYSGDDAYERFAGELLHFMNGDPKEAVARYITVQQDKLNHSDPTWFIP